MQGAIIPMAEAMRMVMFMQRRRRAGARYSRAVVAALLGTLAAAAPAPGQVGLVDDRRAVSVALAGPDVLVARTGRHGSVAVDAVPRAGGASKRIFTLPSPGRDWAAQASLVASAQRLALRVELESPKGALEWRLYSGPPSGPVALDLRAVANSPRQWIPVEHAVDGEQVLVTELRWARPGHRARVLAPGADPVVVPWPGTIFAPTAIAGDLAAFVASERPGRRAPVETLFVVNWRTGAVATSVHVGDPDDVRGRDVDLVADGSVVVADAGRLLTAAPGRQQRAVPHAGRLSAPRFAGAAGIAALRDGRFESERPVAVDPAGGAVRPIGARSVALESFAADAGGAAWLANGCVRYAPLDGSPAPAAPDPCPATELFVEEDEQVLRGRTVRVHVTCVTAPSSCRGTALLGARGRFGRGRFDVPAGTRRRVAVRLTRRGLRYVARRLRVRDPLGLRGASLLLGARVPGGRVPAGYRGKIVAITRRA
jgi:hypothetical protein